MSSNTFTGRASRASRSFAAARASCKWLLLLTLLLSGTAFAEGSRSLFPSTTPAGGARGAMNLANGSSYAGVVNGSQFLYVYANAGEYIEVASSNVGGVASATQNDIFVYNPQSFGAKGNEYSTVSALTPSFKCSSQAGKGKISSRAAELAGPNSADGTTTVTNGYAPCYYVAPSTGIYGVRFLIASSNTGSLNVLATVGPLTGGVAAWDVTVRKTASTTGDVNGRLFSYAWDVNTGGNGAAYQIYADLYYTSVDGYRYKQTMEGLDPNAGVFYANLSGFLDTNGAPLYHDYRGGNSTVTGGASATAGITAQAAQYPLFFNDISPAGANAAEVNTVLSALAIPQTPPAPQLSNVSFAGNVGGNTSTVSSGGTYTFTTVNTQTYQVVISRGAVAAGADPNFPAGCVNDFDPANICNRTLTGIAATGTHNILWDGKDNSGFAFPAGNYSYQIMGRNGEIHFPMLDIEGNVNGGPILQKLNGSQDKTVYYDDRGYKAANGTAVGTLNGVLCGGATVGPIPTPDHSLLGIDSLANPSYRTWLGTVNANADCTSATQYFGDAKGLDLWGFEKTTVFINPIVIVPLTPGVVDVGTSVSVTSSVIAGGTAYGSFVFNNAGAVTASGVTYTVALGNPATPATCPAAVNFTLVPAGVTPTYNPAPACTITFTGMPTTLTGGQSLNFGFNYVVAATNPGPIPITTTIAAANENCVTSCAPDTATAQTVVAKPIITVVKSATPAAGSQVTIGSTITYTLSATIDSAPLTSTFTLTDALGTGLTFGSVTNAGSFTCSGSLTCTLPSGTATGTYTVTYTATVNNSAVGSVANNVTPTGGGGSPPTCNPCSVTHTLPTPTIVYSKTSNPASGATVTAGQTITYTLTAVVSNAALTSNLVLTDTLTAGQTFGSVTSAGSYTANTGGAPVLTFTLPSGTTPGTYAVSYTATVNANATGSVGNAVTAAGGSPTSPTCDPTGVCSTTHPLSNPTIVYSKASNPATGTSVTAGQTLTYTLTATVSQAALTSNLVLTDTLTAGQTFGSVTSAGSYTANTAGAPTLTFTLPSGTAPGTYAVSYTTTVNANATGSVGNAVTAAGGSPTAPTCDPSGVCSTTHPLSNPMIVYSKTSNPTSGSSVTAGQTLTYTLTATVSQAALTSNLVLTDTLTAGQTFGSVTSAGSYTANTAGAPTLTFTLPSGTVAGTYAVSYMTTVNANATGSVGNAVTAAGGSPTAPTCDPSGVCSTTHPLKPSVTVSKTSNPATGASVTAGQTITYTVKALVANAPLANVLTLTDTLSANQTLGAVTNGSFSCGATNPLVCTLPIGTPTGTYTLTYVTTVNANATGNVTNAVVPTGGDNPTCPVACSTTHPLSNPTIVYSKTSNPASGSSVTAGQAITYTLTATVSQAALTSNLVLTDTLTAGQTFGSVTSAGSYTANTAGAPTLTFTLPSGTAPGTYAVSYTTTVNANATGSVGNAVTATGGSPTTPTCDPTGVCSTTHPLAANVSIQKALTAESGTVAGVAEPGENLTYTITLSNTGGVDATGYNLSDAVPANTTFVSASDGGAVTGGVINWANLTVPKQVGATAGTKAVTVTVKVANPIPSGVTSIANVAYATGTTPPTCPNPACVVTPAAGAVTIAKALTAESGTVAGVAEPGENLTYTITLTNTGGVDATGYGLSDAVPANTTFVSASDGGAVTAGVINWTNLTVPRQVGATAGTKAVTVTVKVANPIPAGVTSIANVAYMTGTTPPTCPNPACVVTPTAGTVTIVKTLTGESGSQAGIAEPGETLTYSIKLSNSGGSDVTGYGVTDSLDLHTTYVSSTNGGSYSAGKVTCTGLVVPASGSLTLTVVVTVDSVIPSGVTQIANLVYQTGATPPTCPPAGPQCVITPTAGAVTIAKALTGESGTQAGIAEPGETLTYTITLTNAGGTAVGGFGVTDPLDANMNFVSADNSGADASGVVTWSGLTVPANGNLVLTVVVTVKDPLPIGVAQIMNLAYQTGTPSPDCTLLPTPAACVITPVAARPRLSVTKTADVSQALPSGNVHYTITVSNVGTVTAADVVVSDPLPAGIASFAWTCAASGGAICPNANGSGAINEHVPTFPIGAQLSYSVLAALTGTPVSPVLNVVSVSPSQNTVCVPANTAPPCLASVPIVIGVAPPADPPVAAPINSEWMLLLMLLAIGGSACAAMRKRI